MNVYSLIAAVSAKLAKQGIQKDRKNLQQGYAFRGIDDVLNTLAPLLAEAGLVILPRVLSRELVERPTQNGGLLFSVTVHAEFDFVSANDGSRHTVATFGEAMDSADKATNKAMSAAYKYAAFLAFCIPTEVEDADAVTPDPAAPIVDALRKTPAPGQPRAATTSPAHQRTISQAQGKRFFAIAREHGWTNDAISSLLQRYRLTDAAQIPAVRYQEICSMLLSQPDGGAR